MNTFETPPPNSMTFHPGAMVHVIDSENDEYILRVTEVHGSRNENNLYMHLKDVTGWHYLIFYFSKGESTSDLPDGRDTDWMRLDGIKVNGQVVRARPCFITHW